MLSGFELYRRWVPLRHWIHKRNLDRKPGFERLTIFVLMPQDTHTGDGGLSLPRHVYY